MEKQTEWSDAWLLNSKCNGFADRQRVCYFAGWAVMEVNRRHVFHSLCFCEHSLTVGRNLCRDGDITLCMTSKHSQNILMVGVEGTRVPKKYLRGCYLHVQPTHAYTYSITADKSSSIWPQIIKIGCALLNITQDIQCALVKIPNPVKNMFGSYFAYKSKNKCQKSNIENTLICCTTLTYAVKNM